MSKNSRFGELDAFRGLASLIVVCYHYFFRFDEVYGHADNIPVNWAGLGLYGVHFFFMISGFVIYWSLQKNTGTKEFVVSRMSRILPTYYTALILTFVIMAVFGLPGREASVFEFFMNFTLLQEYFYIRNIDGVYWSLSFEIAFYLFITLLLATGHIKNAHYWLFPLLLISVAMYSGLIEIPYRVTKVLMLKHIGQFIAGIIFYRLYTGSIDITAWIILIVSMALNYLIYPWTEATFLLSFYGVFYLAIKGKLKWINNSFFLWLGSISYSFYLLHQNIGYVIMRKVYELGGSGWLALATAFAALGILSTIVFTLVERPTGRWLKRKFSH